MKLTMLGGRNICTTKIMVGDESTRGEGVNMSKVLAIYPTQLGVIMISMTYQREVGYSV